MQPTPPPSTPATARLYLDDAYRRRCDTTVVGERAGWWLLAQTVFYPGGGGQPADRGFLAAGDARLPVADVRADDQGGVWHCAGAGLAAGHVVCEIDWPSRYALMRHHALMHIVNTVARDEHGGLITGVRLGRERSRVDFAFPAFARDALPAFERTVNEIAARDLAIASFDIDEAEFRRRPELIRTRNVEPPVVAGRVRVVEIAGFDAQACGGTHVHTTAEIGVARIAGYENKGRQNKRLYWTLDERPDPQSAP